MQLSQVPESRRHSKVASASPEKPKEAEVELVGPDGPEVMIGGAR